MKFGANRKTDLLSPEEREIVDRFERGAIDAAEAGRLLIESVRYADPRPGEHPEAAAEAAPHPDETPEEAAARELVERIAREVDSERGR